MYFKKRFLAAVFSATFAMSSQAAVCPPFAETIVIGAIAAAETAYKALQTYLFANLTAITTIFGQLQVSAIKVQTAQVATAAKAQINTAIALKKGEMTAIGHLETVKQQLKVYQDYSAQTGQGVDPCAQLSAQINLTLTNGHSSALAADAINHVAAAPGRYGSSEAFYNRMFTQRQTRYATDDDEKLGFGTANRATVKLTNGQTFALAGADTNAAVLFADSPDPRIQAAKAAYLEHMAGAPDQALSPDVASQPTGKQYLALKGRKDATMSIALHSIAKVSGENSPNPEIGKSNAQARRDLVGQYYGNDAKARWLGWASQSQRGLMVDQLKIDAATLSLEADQYQQSQRIEGLLGALLALESQREFGAALAGSAQALSSAKTRTTIR